MLRLNKSFVKLFVAVVFTGMLVGCGASKGAIEDAAVPVVTQIIKNQLGGDAICQSVKINNEISENFYNATAFIDNGREVKITIEMRENNQIYVTILKR